MKKGTPQCVAPMRPQKFVLCFLYIPLRKNDHWTEIRLLLININNFKQRVSVQWSFFLNEKQKRTGQKKGTLQKNATKNANLEWYLLMWGSQNGTGQCLVSSTHWLYSALV